MQNTLVPTTSRKFVFGTILIFGTLLLYAPSLFFQFLYYDDSIYVFENAFIQKGFTANFFKWVATANILSNWHPVTLISHALDWQIFGSWAGGHHLTNILLHTLNTLLIFLFFLRTTHSPGKSFLLAALFAWHPVKVESVAWVAERKDVLSTFFALLSLLTYSSYVKNKAKPFFLLGLCLFLFALSLMSKPMYVTFPIILFLFDFWPLARNDKNIYARMIEKIPFCFLSAASCWITIKYQSASGSIHHLSDAASWIGVATLAQTYWDYIILFFWPSKLSIFYPYIPNAYPLRSAVGGILLAALTLWLWMQRKKLTPVWIGWTLFITSMLPVIGIVNVGAHSIACRYLYWPSIGLAIMLIWGIEKIKLPKKLLVTLAIVSLTSYALVCSNYLSYWQNTYKLFNYCLKNEPTAWVLHANLHTAYGRDGKHEQAAEHLIQAIGILPDYENRVQLSWFDYFMMGKIFWLRGETEQAFNRFKKAKQVLDQIPENVLTAETLPERTQLNNCLASFDSKKTSNCHF